MTARPRSYLPLLLTLALGALVVSLSGQTTVIPRGGISGGGTITSAQLLAPDGTSLLPAYSFASEPTLGFWRSAAGTVTLQGVLTATGNINGVSFLGSGGVNLGSGAVKTTAAANGQYVWTNTAATSGVTFKFDALPTVGSGFGGTPAVIAGSTPLAGSVNIGTGGAATTGVITFGGTAFPFTPFCTIGLSAGTVATTHVATTTQITLTTGTAWPASTIVTWYCISAKP